MKDKKPASENRIVTNLADIVCCYLLGRQLISQLAIIDRLRGWCNTWESDIKKELAKREKRRKAGLPSVREDDDDMDPFKKA